MTIESELLKIYSEPLAFKHSVYINDVVDPDYFNEFFHKLRNCSPDDIFEIVINSYGGDENTAIQLYNEIKSCVATTVGCVSGYCSAGSMILLACDSFEITKTSKIMIHSTSGAIGGKSHELRAQSNFEEKWIKEFFTQVYDGFLTKTEINDVLAGKDFWLTGEETVKRLQKIKK